MICCDVITIEFLVFTVAGLSTFGDWGTADH